MFIIFLSIPNTLAESHYTFIAPVAQMKQTRTVKCFPWLWLLVEVKELLFEHVTEFAAGDTLAVLKTLVERVKRNRDNRHLCAAFIAWCVFNSQVFICHASSYWLAGHGSHSNNDLLWNSIFKMCLINRAEQQRVVGTLWHQDWKSVFMET